MFWHVENTKLYVLGSIHALEQNRGGLFREAEQVYQDAECVVFEHDMIAPPDPIFIENPTGVTLSSQVPFSVFGAASREWSALGLPHARLEQLQPWTAAMSTAMTIANKRGLVVDAGVDKVLWNRADQDGKTKTTLEMPEAVFTIFVTGPADEKASFLNYAVNPTVDFQNDLDTMVRAWHEHDISAIERIYLHRLKTWPATFGQLIAGRNQGWLPKIRHLIADQVPTLVVVGALHCVGPDGVPSLLERENYQLTRVV